MKLFRKSLERHASLRSARRSGMVERLSKQLQFLFVARGSLFEVETPLYLASDLGYTTKVKLDELLPDVTHHIDWLLGKGLF